MMFSFLLLLGLQPASNTPSQHMSGMVCGEPTLLTTSDFQTVRYCEQEQAALSAEHQKAVSAKKASKALPAKGSH